MKLKSLNWFIKRIGKTIYSEFPDCSCASCQSIKDIGILVDSKNQAKYLYNLQNDFASEGVFLNYRDEK